MAARSDSLFASPAPATRREIFARKADAPAVQPAGTPTHAFLLTSFTPFRLNRLAAGVSDHLAGLYKARFGLEIAEWRVMATVGPARGCTAQHIADSTRQFLGLA